MYLVPCGHAAMIVPAHLHADLFCRRKAKAVGQREGPPSAAEIGLELYEIHTIPCLLLTVPCSRDLISCLREFHPSLLSILFTVPPPWLKVHQRFIGGLDRIEPRVRFWSVKTHCDNHYNMKQIHIYEDCVVFYFKQWCCL